MGGSRPAILSPLWNPNRICLPPSARLLRRQKGAAALLSSATVGYDGCRHTTPPTPAAARRDSEGGSSGSMRSRRSRRNRRSCVRCQAAGGSGNAQTVASGKVAAREAPMSPTGPSAPLPLRPPMGWGRARYALIFSISGLSCCCFPDTRQLSRKSHPPGSRRHPLVQLCCLKNTAVWQVTYW